MSYLYGNPKTKKAAKELLKEKGKLDYFEPGIGDRVTSGTVYLEGPHFPEPHRWYAQGKVEGGQVVEIK